MEFVEAVRLVYHLANRMELTVDEQMLREAQRDAERQSQALDLAANGSIHTVSPEWLRRTGGRLR
jgi:hypothetical protein